MIVKSSLEVESILLGHENFIDEYYDANDLLNQDGFQIDGSN